MALTLLADRQYTAPSAANSVSITPSGVAWTNSAYVTVLDPTPTACVLTGVTVYTTHGASASVAYDFEVDIATGAAAAEVVIATVRGYLNRVFSATITGPTHTCVLPIPIDTIGSGVRVAARLRKNNTNTTAWTVAISYLQKPLTSPILITTTVQKALPPAAASVTVTASATPWTSGTWVQLRSASGAALVVTGLVWGAPSLVNVDYEVDLGTGAASSETVITTVRLNVRDATTFPAYLMLPAPLDTIAASTRVAARLRCASASRTLVVSLLVLEKPL